MERDIAEMLLERVELMERQLRVWRIIGLAAALALVALLGLMANGRAGAEEKHVGEYNIEVPAEVFRMGQPQYVETLKARRILLVDVSGEPRARFQVTEVGTPVLELLGQKGRTQAALTVKGQDSPSMVFYDHMGRVLWRAP